MTSRYEAKHVKHVKYVQDLEPGSVVQITSRETDLGLRFRNCRRHEYFLPQPEASVHKKPGSVLIYVGSYARDVRDGRNVHVQAAIDKIMLHEFIDADMQILTLSAYVDIRMSAYDLELIS